MDGWMDGWTDGRTDGWMDVFFGSIDDRWISNLYACLMFNHVYMYGQFGCEVSWSYHQWCHSIYIYIYLSKLKSGERLTPPKANVCGERCASAVRACGARVRCAIYARSNACTARYTRAMIVLTPRWNIYTVYTSALGLLKPQHSISMVSFTFHR